MRKFIVSFVLLLLFSVFTMSFAACGGNAPTTATVKFTYKDKDADYATVISTVVVPIGETVGKPADPIEAGEGYRIAWYNGDAEWDFNDKVTADMTIRAVKMAISYSITYELNGSENNGGNPDSYTANDIIILNPAWDKQLTDEEMAELQAKYDNIIIQSAVYSFTGWKFKGDEGEPVPDLVIVQGTTGDITLVACFSDTPTIFGVGVDEELD